MLDRVSYEALSGVQVAGRPRALRVLSLAFQTLDRLDGLAVLLLWLDVLLQRRDEHEHGLLQRIDQRTTLRVRAVVQIDTENLENRLN